MVTDCFTDANCFSGCCSHILDTLQFTGTNKNTFVPIHPEITFCSLKAGGGEQKNSAVSFIVSKPFP